MINFEQLAKLGSTKERLREVCTAQMPSDQDRKGWTKEQTQAREKDIERRKFLEKRLSSRLEEHVTNSLKNHAPMAAVDLAWDASPITKQTLPLIQYAQGKIDLQSAAKTLDSLDCGKYVTKDDKGQAKSIALDLFINVDCNLVRSVTTRRLAAQSAKYSNLWPYYKFEARGTSQAAKLRADALSQIVDAICDQFDYKHHEVQVMRDMLLYGHSVDFVRASWECEKQILDDTGETVVKEGVGWANPHPTRTFWDTAFPLPSLNTDTGVSYIGYWDVRRYGDVLDNPAFYNTKEIKYSQSFWNIYAAYPSYFSTYYQNSIRIPNPEVPPPTGPAGGVGMNPIEDNDRRSHIGIYSGEERDQSVLLCEYFEKLIPQAHGFGEYNHPVWTRFLVAGDGTVVFAEFMPSTPGAVASFNENDSRLMSISCAHEIMPYQDQMSNLITAMLLKIQQELLTFVSINSDIITNPEDRKKIRSILEGGHYASSPIVAEVSFSKLADMGLKPGDAFTIKRAVDGQSTQSITDCIRGQAQLIQMMERLLALSPHEQGQTASHEITAKETSVIEATTSTVYGFISDAIDELRSAKKRIVFESLVACSKSDWQVPVVNRYDEATIAAAGFTAMDDSDPVKAGPRYVTLTVNARKFGRVHDYVFTSRDGAERPINTSSAQALVQMLGNLPAIAAAGQIIGKVKLYEIMNEIFRSATGTDLALEVQPGDEKMAGDQTEQLGQMVNQFAQQFQSFVQQQQQANQQFGQSAQVTDQLGQAVAQLAKQVEQTAGRVAEIESIPSQTTMKVAESIKYADTPPDVQRQIEAIAGLTPSTQTPPPTPPEEPFAPPHQ